MQRLSQTLRLVDDSKAIVLPGVGAFRDCMRNLKDNIFATQFHPEKSQETGLRILKNFGDFTRKA